MVRGRGELSDLTEVGQKTSGLSWFGSVVHGPQPRTAASAMFPVTGNGKIRKVEMREVFIDDLGLETATEVESA